MFNYHNQYRPNCGCHDDNSGCSWGCDSHHSPYAYPCPWPIPNICPPTYCPPPPAPTSTIVITNTNAITNVPSGAIPAIPIPAGSTTIPVGTVTPITALNPIPTTSVGGITFNTTNGQFTVPLAGRYLVSASVVFSVNPTGTRQLYVYKITAASGIISLVSATGANAALSGPTYLNISTVAEMAANDRLFFAVTQDSGAALTISTDTKFVISLLN